MLPTREELHALVDQLEQADWDMRRRAEAVEVKRLVIECVLRALRERESRERPTAPDAARIAAAVAAAVEAALNAVSQPPAPPAAPPPAPQQPPRQPAHQRNGTH